MKLQYTRAAYSEHIQLRVTLDLLFASTVHCLTYFLKSSLTIIASASLSIFFSDPSADYYYSDTGSGAAGYISLEDDFYSFSRICRKDPPTLCSKQQEAWGLHSVSALFWQSAHHLEFSRALHGISTESTRTILVSTRQDLKE